MSGRLLDPIVNVPPSIQQGDTVTWLDYPFSDVGGVLYPSANWNLVFSYIQNGGSTGPVSVTAAAQGTGWLTTLSATQTAQLVPGAKYAWQSQLQGIADTPTAGLAITVDDNFFGVTPSIASAAAGYDARTPNEIALANWKAALAALSGSGGTPVLSYKIGIREMRYRDIKEIRDTIAYFQAQVLSETVKNSIAQNQGNPRKLYMRFPSNYRGTGS